MPYVWLNRLLRRGVRMFLMDFTVGILFSPYFCQKIWNMWGAGSSAFSWVWKGYQCRWAARNMFPVCCITVQHVRHCSVLFTTELQGQVCEQHVFAHFSYVCFAAHSVAESVKKQICAVVAGLHTLHHCSIYSTTERSELERGMSGLWECHCAESTGGEQLLHCAAVRLAAFMQHFNEGHRRLLALWALLTRPLPAGHWPVVPTVPAARQASEDWRLSHSNWCLGSGWSKVPGWLLSLGNFPFSDALQSLPVALSSCLLAQTLTVPEEGESWCLSALLTFIKPTFLIRDDRVWLPFVCPLKILFLC